MINQSAIHKNPFPRRLWCMCVITSVVLLGIRAAEARESSADGNSTEIKIRLMSDALQAIDSGDFRTARSRLDSLRALSPNDPQISRLLHEVDAGETRASLPRDPIQRHSADVSASERPRLSTDDQAMAGTAPASAAPTQPQSILPVERESDLAATQDNALGMAADEAARQRRILDDANRRYAHARELVIEERFEEALGELRQVKSDLPENPLTSDMLRQVQAQIVDVEHRERVAAISAKDIPPILSVVEGAEDRGSANASASRGDFAPTVRVDLQILEVPAAVVDDLWVAWGNVLDDLKGGHRPIALDRRGRPEYQRRGGAAGLLTPRQTCIANALRRSLRGIPRDADLPNGAVGFSAELDPELLVRVLAGFDGCRLLASPRLSIETGAPTSLVLKAQSSGTGGQAAQWVPSWTIVLRPSTPLEDGRVDLAIEAKASRYRGVIVTPATGTRGPDPSVNEARPVYGLAESSFDLRLGRQDTFVFAGLTRHSDHGWISDPQPWVRIPIFGRWGRAIEEAKLTREILLFVRAGTQVPRGTGTTIE